MSGEQQDGAAGRGSDETPLARVRAFQRAADPNGDYHWPAEEAANINGVPLYFDDIESLISADNFDAVEAVVASWHKAERQLVVMTARAKQAEAEAARLKSADLSGWTAEENAEFERRYGIKAAMRLRAAHDRVWQIVQELRQAAVDAGRDPYQDPMAQRLSAALIGVEDDAELAKPEAASNCPSPYRDGTCRHLTCGRCGQHTNNSTQGHWWAYCKVTKTKREFHFCCPGDCELEQNGATEAEQ